MTIYKNIFLTIILLLYQVSIAFCAAEIPEKYYKKPLVPIFVTSGFINFSAVQRDQASSFERANLVDGFTTNHLKNNQFFGNDSQFYFKSAVMTQSHAKYGAVAKLEFNVNSDKRNENLNLDQAFIFAENDFGKFEIGNNKAVNQMMKVGPARFARGAGGINGKYLEHVNFSMLADSSQSTSPICSGTAFSGACANVKLPKFILLAQSPIGHGGYAKSFYRRGVDNNYNSEQGYGDSDQSRFRALKDDSFDGFEDSTKINYYTPRIAGLQMGLSYTPTTAGQGVTATTTRDLDFIRMENIFSFGVNYSGDFDNLGILLSATAEKGQIKNSKSTFGTERLNLFSYDFAATLSYFGFNFGLSYGSWQKSLQAKSGIYSCDYNANLTLAEQNCNGNFVGFRNPYYYTAGIAYGFGPIALSITGLKSEFQKNNYKAISFDIDYKLTRDLIPYFEITKFTFKSNQVRASDVLDQSSVAASQRQIRDNQGYVFLTGILFLF